MSKNLLLIVSIIANVQLYSISAQASQHASRWQNDRPFSYDQLYSDYQIYADSDNQQQGRKNLTKEQQERLQRRREYYEALPPEEQERIRRARSKYKEMPAEEKKRLRKRWENMTPKERKRFRKWKKQQKTGR